MEKVHLLNSTLTSEFLRAKTDNTASPCTPLLFYLMNCISIQRPDPALVHSVEGREGLHCSPERDRAPVASLNGGKSRSKIAAVFVRNPWGCFITQFGPTLTRPCPVLETDNTFHLCSFHLALYFGLIIHIEVEMVLLILFSAVGGILYIFGNFSTQTHFSKYTGHIFF